MNLITAVKATSVVYTLFSLFSFVAENNLNDNVKAWMPTAIPVIGMAEMLVMIAMASFKLARKHHLINQ